MLETDQCKDLASGGALKRSMTVEHMIHKSRDMSTTHEQHYTRQMSSEM